MKQNPFINILLTILLPILVLNKGGAYLGEKIALLVAVLLPLIYFAWDWFQNKHINGIAILGILNVLVTGIFAFIDLEGAWFAVKEGAFPFFIAVFVAFSAKKEKPFITMLFLNEQLFKIDLIKSKATEKGRESELKKLLVQATYALSGSFLLSALLNFFLALWIFQPIPTDLIGDERSRVLNEQIATMTGWSYPVIALPSLLALVAIFFFVLKSLKRITGLESTELMAQQN